MHTIGSHPCGRYVVTLPAAADSKVPVQPLGPAADICAPIGADAPLSNKSGARAVATPTAYLCCVFISAATIGGPYEKGKV